MNNLTDVQNFILSLISSALFGVDYCIVPCDWEELKNELYAQAVFTLVYPLMVNLLPSSEKSKWENLFETITAKNLFVDYEHTELHELMEQNNIKYTIIKGSSSAAYYPDPLKRMMGDLDFIIHKCDINKVSKILESVGFYTKCKNNKSSHLHISFYRDESIWELHYAVPGIPQVVYHDTIDEYMSDIIEKSILYNNNERVFRVPCTFHHGMVLLLHTASHLIKTGIGLRHLCDWAVFISNISDEEFVELFEMKLKKIGLWKFACVLTLLSEKYLNSRHCSWINLTYPYTEEYLEKLIINILNSGNFGVKDIQRLNQGKLISDTDRRRVDSTNSIRQIIFSMNAETKVRIPIVKKYPFLMPIGWLFVLIWYISLLLRTYPKISKCAV